MTYAEFETKITEMLKIRLTNYRLTSNDIAYLIEYIFDDIQNDVILKFVYQYVDIKDTGTTYDLDALYAIDFPEATEFPFDVVGIFDVDMNPLINSFIEPERNKYTLVDKIKDFTLFSAGHSEDDIAVVQFKRKAKFLAQDMDSYILRDLFPVVVQGIVFTAEDAIPSPVSSPVPAQSTQIVGQIYKSMKSNLLSRYPQQ